MGVQAFGSGPVGHGRREILAALGAVVLGVGKMDIAGPTRNQIPPIMQDALKLTVSRAAFAAPGAGTFFEIATASDHFRLGQIFRLGNALGGVRKVRSGTRHDKALHGKVFPGWKLRHLPGFVMVKFPVVMLKTQLYTVLSSG